MKPILVSLALLLLSAGSAQAGPSIEHWELENGARVYFVAADALPIVDVRIIFDAGGARDGEVPGLARLTNSLLNQGAGGMDADAIAVAFEGVGARFSSGSERDMASLHLRSLAREQSLRPALDTLALVLGQPEFPEAALERQRRRMQIALQGERQSPAALGSRALYSALYGDHPYGSPPQGTEESLAAIDRDAVRAFHRRYYVASNAVIAIVGDLERAQAEHLAAQLLGELPQGEPAPTLPVPPMVEAQTVHIPFPSTQTHILIGQVGIARSDVDHFPLQVGNHILGGGGLVSLLAHEMRERRGLSYSSYSYFIPSAAAGPYIIGSQVRADRTGEALEVLQSLFADFRNEGPTEEQLTAARQNITGGFPLSLDSNSKIVGQVGAIGFYRMPLDYLDTYTEQVEAVRADDIRNTYQRRLDPRRQVTVLVGPQGLDADTDAAADTDE
jgi:zinc protease